MDYELPTEFDLIIIGTGVVESVVSAAASRIGKRVLHIDSKNYYGGYWASFSLDSFQKLHFAETERKCELPPVLKDGEQILSLGNNSFDLKDFHVDWHVPGTSKSETPEATNEDLTDIEKPKIWTQESLLKDSRKFNIDLAPKLQFARGDFVELLISSNIARYSEYRSVSRVLTWLNGQLEAVPCSRSDVFANNKVSVIEKRMLMKLFTSLDNDEKEMQEHEAKPFRTFLKEKKLSANLIHYVLYAIAMGSDETSCIEGIRSCRRFLDSLGRFGKTPFLFSMYGSGEITQGFCRLSAVFGGIYALSQSLNGLIVDNNSFKGVICGKQRIQADSLVMGVEKSPKELLNELPKSCISRAVFITNKSVMDSEKEHLTLLLYPPENGKNLITILEMGALTGTCPKDLFLVHLIAKQISNPQEDFKDCVQNLFSNVEEAKPQILWSAYFSLPDSNELDLNAKAPGGVTICPGPDLDLDYDFSIKKAKDVFLKIYPDSEFLPRAPDPEEIVIEGEETGEKGEEVVLKPESDVTSQDISTY